MKYTKAQRRHDLYNRLANLGFTFEESSALRRIEMTLHKWAEHECGDSNDRYSTSIERDEATGKPYWVVRWHCENKDRRTPVADRENGALRRLAKIISDRNTREWIGYAGPISEMPRFIRAYHQGDPRGCALYLLTNADLAGIDSPIDSCYTRGLAVCD